MTNPNSAKAAAPSSRILPLGSCAYCGHQTTASLVDTAGVKIPVCGRCKRIDSTPPQHDPDYSPDWRVPNRGARGPNWTRSAGVSIDTLALRWGVSRQAAWKRVRAAKARGPEALASLLAPLALNHGYSVPQRKDTAVQVAAIEALAKQLPVSDLEALVGKLVVHLARVTEVTESE